VTDSAFVFGRSGERERKLSSRSPVPEEKENAVPRIIRRWRGRAAPFFDVKEELEVRLQHRPEKNTYQGVFFLDKNPEGEEERGKKRKEDDRLRLFPTCSSQ